MITQALKSGVVLDIDGTLADTASALKDLLIATGLTGMTAEFLKPNTDPQDRRVFIHEIYSMQAFLDATIKDLFSKPEVYQNALPLPGAVEGAQALQAAGLLKGYATRRPYHLSPETGRWLQQWGFPDLGISYTETPSKSSCMRFFNAGAIIEDSPHEVFALDIEHHALLIDAHYNRVPLPTNVTRVTWETIKSLI